VMLVILILVLGLPVAWFTTRKLDRLLEISASVFE